MIGYSDSRDFSARVGPAPADNGQFADVVRTRVVSEQKEAKEGAAELPLGRSHQPREEQETRGRPAAQQQFLKASLFDWLPPPSASAS